MRKERKVYSTVDEYLKDFKIGDRIALAGYGIIDGIKSVANKRDTYKVSKGTTQHKIVVTAYNKRTKLSLGADMYDQQILVLSASDYKNLPN